MIDAYLPGLNGLELLKRLRSAGDVRPAIGIVIPGHRNISVQPERIYAHHRAGVMGLIDVLEHHGQVPRAFRCDAIEKRATPAGDEAAELLVQLRVGHVMEAVQK